MNFTNGVWAVEYAKGFLPFSMPFGAVSEYFICADKDIDQNKKSV